MRKGKDASRQVGDTVYCHAFADNNDQLSYFLCQAIITRRPSKDSPVFKVTVIKVNPFSVLCGHQPDLASQLLGRKIPRTHQQIIDKLKSTGLVLYNTQQNVWLQLDNKQIAKITSKLKKINK